MHLIDTDVAIHLRDGTVEIYDRLDALSSAPQISWLSWVELEGGVYTKPSLAATRRIALDVLLNRLEVLPTDDRLIAEYGRIVAVCGFSRPRVTDRLIAATAIVHGLTLTTMNGDDFRDIPGLDLEIWPAPAQ